MLRDPDWKVGGAEVVWRNGTYFLHVTQSREAPAVTPAEEVIGIDLGAFNIATDSQGEQFTGARCGRNAAASSPAVPLCNGWELVRPNGVSSR